jgi:glycosyltransferase involved in cell wall biosynthesis
MNELVSIVIPCYNHAKYLPDALISILNQTYSNWECIILNDGSPDNTDEVAQEWVLKDIRFKYYKKENGGLSSARNYGIERALGQYILTLDADDKFESTFIEKAIDILYKNNAVGIVSCWGYRFKINKYYGLFKPQGKDLSDYLFCNAASAGSVMFRKKCWCEVNGYDEQMKNGYEDWEFYLRVSQKGWKTIIMEEPLFYYRQHSNSMRIMAIKDHDREIKSYIFTKHKELYIKNFEKTIDNLLSIAELNKRNEMKRLNSIDFKIGSFILKPFRFIKGVLK